MTAQVVLTSAGLVGLVVVFAYALADFARLYRAEARHQEEEP